MLIVTCKLLISFLLGLSFPSSSQAEPPFSHRTFDLVLTSFVDEVGLVAYPELKVDRKDLDAYIDSIGRVSPLSHPERFPSPPDHLAYWINTYNALVLRGVIDAYPIKTVKDIYLFNGFFNRHTWRVGEQEITLDAIENKIIRPQFNDPRIHFVLNCGAKSCPPLEKRAFIGHTLEARLDRAAKRFALSEQFFLLKENRLFLSKILEWYRSDFDNASTTHNMPDSAIDPLISYFIPLVESPLKEQLKDPSIKIEFMEYDWSLNGQANRPDQNY